MRESDRPPCLAHSPQRLLRNEIPRERLYGTAGFWDEAIREGSGHRAAASRHFMDESRDAFGVSHCWILFDVEFHGSLDIGPCVDRCLDLEHSPTITPSAPIYLGPRRLRDRSSVSLPIDPNVSIAAVRGYAKNAAAAFLYPTYAPW